MVLEKAWAKLVGSYARAEFGHAHFAAQHLIGTPGAFIPH